jgi:hypothetical protein
MGKYDKKEEFELELVGEPVAAPKKAPPTLNAGRVGPTPKMTFDRYVKKMGVKASHVPGLRAFVKSPNALRTEAEWAALLKDY